MGACKLPHAYIINVISTLAIKRENCMYSIICSCGEWLACRKWARPGEELS